MRHLTFIIASLLAWSVHAQELKGSVVDSSQRPLHRAHVRNLSKKQLVITGADGTFRLPASMGDSLLITFVGYADYFFLVQAAHLQHRISIPLQEKELTLEDVVVTPFSNYSQKPVIELDSLEAIPLYLPEVTFEYDYDPREEPIPDKMSPTFGTGIRLDFEKLTKRGKEKMHYAESLDADEKWKIAEQKFNREWLTELTKLEGDDLTYFIAYCNFSVDYLAQASILDIQDHVLAKLEKYRLEGKPK